MRRLVCGALWLAVFAAVFAMLGLILGLRLHMRLGGLHQARLAGMTMGAAMGAALGAVSGAVAGIGLFALAVRRGWLPGLWPPGLRPRWGLAQVAWLLLGFVVAQIAGAGLYQYALPKLLGALTHRPVAGQALVGAAVSGYLCASLFSLWYIGRLGPARLRDGSATGLAWAPAPKRAYLTACLCAAAIIVLVIAIVHVFPPNLTRLKTMPSAKLFESPGPSGLALVALAVFIAPPVEEYVFRGGIFAALASRVSPFWAGAITTVLFMAVHAPEKIYYLPGFIDVGLMAATAAWMRVRFGSIRPGILLHVLYNGGLMLAAGLAG